MIDNWLDDFRALNADVAEDENHSKEKENAIPLQEELLAMDLGNKNFYRELSEEQKKAFKPWLLMRYMSSSTKDSEHHLMMTNDIVNNNFNNIRKHPELQWYLLTICGTGKKQFHPWIAPPKGIKKNKLEDFISNHFPLLNSSEIELLLKINTKEDFEKFFKDSGCDDKTIKELLQFY